MAMALFVAMLSLSFTACSDDENDELHELTDYYVTCTVSGGGLSPQDLDNRETEYNAYFADEYIEGVDYAHAIYWFNDVVEDFQERWEHGDSDVSGTLRVTLQLKNKSGEVIRTATVNITNEGSHIS